MEQEEDLAKKYPIQHKYFSVLAEQFRSGFASSCPEPQNLPDVLVHYTSLETFQSIISYKTLRASNHRYLNDYMEYYHGLSLVNEEFEFAAEQWRDDDLSRIRGRVLDHLTNRTDRNTYVTCFSEFRDSLSQWRSYGSTGSNVAIIFDPKELAGLSISGAPNTPNLNRTCFFLKVTYERSAQKQLIRQYIDDARSAFVGLREVEPEQVYVGDMCWLTAAALEESLHRLLTSFKHPGFAEEMEWRLIAEPNQEEKDLLGYRISRGLVIPYIELINTASTTPKTDLPIKEIMLGPNNHRDLNMQSISSLLKKHGMDSVVVSSTQTPLRVF